MSKKSCGRASGRSLQPALIPSVLEGTRTEWRLNRRLAGLLLLFLLAACTTKLEVDDLPSDSQSTQHLREVALHIIEVDSDGEGDEVDLGDETITWCEKAQAEKNREGSDDDIVVLREQFKCVIKEAIDVHKRVDKKVPCGNPYAQEEGRPLCLLFYFNGGRNDKVTVMRTAAKTYQKIEEDGFYPIYMIWPTGDIQSYSEDMVRVRAGRLNNWPWKDWPQLESWETSSTSLMRPMSDLLRGLASTPAAWGTSLVEFYRTGFGFGSDDYMMKRDWELHVSMGQPIGKRVEIKPNQNLYSVLGCMNAKMGRTIPTSHPRASPRPMSNRLPQQTG